jgi:hypothetical protein
MASIKIDNYIIDIVIHSIDGMFDKILEIPFQKGFWVYLTVQNEAGSKESFPSIDKDCKVKIYNTYADAINDIAFILKKYIQ